MRLNASALGVEPRTSFTATSTSRAVERAFQTTPMPPLPSGWIST
jgi:hypothetical protein